MPLTRGDKTIIIGAVVLALAVVAGLAVLKKPHLFSLGAKPVPLPAEPMPVPQVGAPVTPPPQVVAPPPAAPAQAAPAAPAAPQAVSPAPTPVPSPAPTATTPPPPPAGPAAGAPAGKGPSFAGDETLEKMFAEMGNKAAPETPPAPPPAATQAAPSPEAAAPSPAPAPAAAPAPAPAQEKPAKGKAAKPAPAKPVPGKPAAKPEAKPVAKGGSVVRIIAEEKAGEYELIVQTNAPPAGFQKFFMADPPRMVLDIDGAWNYNGPLAKTTGNGFVKEIRVGKHPDKFRVVLDLTSDALGKLRGTPTLERVPEGVRLRIPK